MSAHVITLKCGLTDPGSRPEIGRYLKDVTTGLMPQIWAGARTNFRLIFQNPVTSAPIDTGDWSLVTFRLLATDRTTLFTSKSVVPSGFAVGPPKETTVALSTTETTLPEGEYWISIFATLATGGLVPQLAGPIKITDAGMLTTVAPPPIQEPVYTQAQIDAMLAAILGGDTGGISVVAGNALFTSSGQTWTWPVALIGTATTGGLTVVAGNAILTISGRQYTWPVAETTYVSGAPFVQVFGANLIISIGGRSFTNPVALV